MTMSPSPFTWKNSWHVYVPFCAGPRGTLRANLNAVDPSIPASIPAVSRVTCDGAHIKLTSHEYRLLAYLMHHKGRVVSRTELVEHLYEQDFDRDSNTIEVFVGRLRKKLPSDLIKTVRGLGYCLAEAENET